MIAGMNVAERRATGIINLNDFKIDFARTRTCIICYYVHVFVAVGCICGENARVHRKIKCNKSQKIVWPR